jgi:hypothetical protein
LALKHNTTQLRVSSELPSALLRPGTGSHLARSTTVRPCFSSDIFDHFEVCTPVFPRTFRPQRPAFGSNPPLSKPGSLLSTVSFYSWLQNSREHRTQVSDLHTRQPVRGLTVNGRLHCLTISFTESGQEVHSPRDFWSLLIGR